MRFIQMTSCLTKDASRLAEVADGNMAQIVPTCPDWSVEDLIRHVAFVYAHKVKCIQLGESPNPWPPEPTQPALTHMRSALGDLLAEFTAHEPSDHAYTWYEPDQTVGFWIRRMAQETVIHRVDAELAAGADISPIDEELAYDGIDEFLKIFVDWSSKLWPGQVADAMSKAATDEPIAIMAGDQSWTVHVSESTVNVVEGIDDTQNHCATVSGSPAQVLLWLWRRARTNQLTVSGDIPVTDRFYEMLATFSN